MKYKKYKNCLVVTLLILITIGGVIVYNNTTNEDEDQKEIFLVTLSNLLQEERKDENIAKLVAYTLSLERELDILKTNRDKEYQVLLDANRELRFLLNQKNLSLDNRKKQ